MPRQGRLSARRVLRWSAWLVAGLAVAWFAGSLLVSWRLSRRWRTKYAEHPPAAIAQRVESLRLTTRDREELGAWYLPASAPAPSVAMFHGLGGARSARVSFANVFERAGCAVLLVTHRAHGDSTGEREDYGWSAQHDVVAAVEWLERARPGAPIIVCGASLGAAAATYAASELGTRVAGYVLECPYASLDHAARHRCDAFLPPVIDWVGYMGVCVGAACFAPNWSASAPLESVRAIPSNVPVLFLAGERDQRAPVDEVRQIAANVRGPNELVIVPGADHDRLLATGSNFYATAVSQWLARHFAPSELPRR